MPSNIDSCKYCNKEFKSENSLKEHYRHCKEKKYHDEKTKKNNIRIVVILLFILLAWFLITSAMPKCPESCNDGDPCTADFCSELTNYTCENIYNEICGYNDICEQGEYGTSECPDCDDGDKYTIDDYDYNKNVCKHEHVDCEHVGIDCGDQHMSCNRECNLRLSGERKILSCMYDCKDKKNVCEQDNQDEKMACEQHRRLFK